MRKEAEMTTTTLECLSDNGPTMSQCLGPVEWHSLDPGRLEAFPRCEKHWGERIEEDQKHKQNYPDSPFAPSWFSPLDAGEHWDEDY